MDDQHSIGSRGSRSSHDTDPTSRGSHGSHHGDNRQKSKNKSHGQGHAPQNSAKLPSLQNRTLPAIEHDPAKAEGKGPPTIVAFKKPLFGDLFGTHTSSDFVSGMMYRSRLVDDVVPDEGSGVPRSASTVDDGKKADKDAMKKAELGFGSCDEGDPMDGDSDSEDDDSLMLKTMNSKQQLAVTIKNWSFFPKNDYHIIREGAVYALIALAVVDDPLIKKYCATAFLQLSSRIGNREQLLAIGATTGVIALAMQSRTW